jgi:hypothetical protein
MGITDRRRSAIALRRDEHEVLALLARGSTLSQAPEPLHYSRRTVARSGVSRRHSSPGRPASSLPRQSTGEVGRGADRAGNHQEEDDVHREAVEPGRIPGADEQPPRD